jgi:hypothetical protein
MKKIFILLNLIIFTLCIHAVDKATAKVVSASTASGYPGDEVQIDISIDDWIGVAGGDITLKYDATKLSVVSAVKAPAFGLNVIINTATAGKVVVTMAGYPGLPGGSGAIINIIFKIADDAPRGITIPLPFDEAQLYDEDGNDLPTTSISGEVIIPNGEGKTVSASTASGYPGDEVQIDISIDDWTGVAGGDIALTYDDTKLSVVSAQKATAFGLNVIINTATSGTIVVTMAGYPGLPSGSGAVVNIIFQIADDAPAGSTPLTFDEAQLYDEDGNNIPTTSTPGEIIIGGVPEVEVSLTAPAIVSFEEDITAEVVVTQVNNLDTASCKLSFDNIVVAYQKVDLTGTLTEGASLVVNDTTPGELIVIINLPGVSGVSGAGAIAKVIFKPIVACITTLVLSDVMLGDIYAKEIPSEIVVPEVTVEITSIPGDADGNGEVNILDITKAERILVGLDSIPPGGNPDCNEDGKFLPNDITCIEYKAAGLPIPTVALTSRGESARLRLLTYTVGKRILKAKIYTNGVNNLDIAYFVLEFNPEVLQLMEVSSGKLTSDANPTANIDNTEGNIRFVLNLPGVTGVSGSGTLAELEFKIVKKTDVSENLILSDVFLGDTSGRQINCLR